MNNENFILQTNLDLNENDWYHLTFVAGRRQALIYFNGTLIKNETKTVSLKPSLNQSIRIGKSILENEPTSKVIIDDIKIFSKALNKREVNYYYQK